MKRKRVTRRPNQRAWKAQRARLFKTLPKEDLVVKASGTVGPPATPTANLTDQASGFVNGIFSTHDLGTIFGGSGARRIYVKGKQRVVMSNPWSTQLELDVYRCRARVPVPAAVNPESIMLAGFTRQGLALAENIGGFTPYMCEEFVKFFKIIKCKRRYLAPGGEAIFYSKRGLREFCDQYDISTLFSAVKGFEFYYVQCRIKAGSTAAGVSSRVDNPQVNYVCETIYDYRICSATAWTSTVDATNFVSQTAATTTVQMLPTTATSAAAVPTHV